MFHWAPKRHKSVRSSHFFYRLLAVPTQKFFKFCHSLLLQFLSINLLKSEVFVSFFVEFLRSSAIANGINKWWLRISLTSCQDTSAILAFCGYSTRLETGPLKNIHFCTITTWSNTLIVIFMLSLVFFHFAVWWKWWCWEYPSKEGKVKLQRGIICFLCVLYSFMITVL